MELLTSSSPRSLQLLIAPAPYQAQIVSRFTADLARVGPVRVLDGGNRFDVLRINRELRGKQRSRARSGGSSASWERASAEDFYPALQRIRVARAFTCYQMVTLLEETACDETPTLVLNLLTTFRDENVPLPERRRLLRTSLHWLDKAARRAPVMLFLHPPPAEEDFLEQIHPAVDHLWKFEAPESAQQLALF